VTSCISGLIIHKALKISRKFTGGLITKLRLTSDGFQHDGFQVFGNLWSNLPGPNGLVRHDLLS